MSESGEIYTAGKNFTLPPALTAWTNSTSGSWYRQVAHCWAEEKNIKGKFCNVCRCNWLSIVFNIILGIWSFQSQAWIVVFVFQHEPCHRMIISLGIGIVQIENYSLPPSCAIITTIVIIVFSSSNNSIINHHCQSPQNLDLLRKKLQEVPGIRCQGETRSRSCNGGANISTPFVNSWAKRLSHISHQIELMFQWNLLQEIEVLFQTQWPRIQKLVW